MDQAGDDFIRKNAAAIAEALRRQEELAGDAGNNGGNKSEGKKNVENDASIYDLYRALCFDDPLVENDRGCRELGRQLLCHDNSKSKGKEPRLPSLRRPAYALSNRFVNGLLQCCQRTEGSSDQFAALAYTVFVEIPLQCCQSESDLAAIQRYLGSYKGTSAPTQVFGFDNDALRKAELFSDLPTSNISENNAGLSDPENDKLSNKDGNSNSTQNVFIGGSLEEVWATESDPSDYDYGDGANAGAPQLEQDDWIDELIIDPEKLSKPDQLLTFQQAQAAIKSLLQHAKYNIFAPLFQKKQDKTTQQLTQLLLMLFTAEAPGAMSPSSLLDETMKPCGFEPLWILRDAAMDRKAFVAPYLDVIQTLLAVDHAKEEDEGKRQHDGHIASATVVGVTSLSAWCSQNDFGDDSTLLATQECIVQAINDLSHIVEKILLAGGTNTSANRNHLINHMIPIVEVLSGTDWMGQKRSPKSPCTNPRVPQALLNSGFFRNLLVLALGDNIPEHLKYQFHHSLLLLCVASPTVLGKYAWRYSGISSIVIVEPITTTGMVHSILWNILGYKLCSDLPASGTSMLRSIKPSDTGAGAESPILSIESCQKRCQDGWNDLCLKCGTSLESLLHSTPSTLHEEASQAFERLAKTLVSHAVLREIFLLIVEASCLDNIHRIVSMVPRDSAYDRSADENDETDHASRRKRSSRNELVAQFRKVLKSFSLMFEAIGDASSKTD